MAVTRTDIPVFIDELMYVTGGPVKVADYGFPGSPELAQNLVAALEDRQAALLANHGAIGLGDDLAEALHVCEVVEKISEVYISALKIGPVFQLEPSVIEHQAKAFLAKKARQRDQQK
jgi:ribulose-5-phosphate 4-epimerase/fuculose-1-phosphate aldolase